LKSSLKGWHPQWFYVANHEPSLPPFHGSSSPSMDTWKAEPSDAKINDVLELTKKIKHLSLLGLTGVGVTASWLSRRVIPLKQQMHPSWEYSGTTDPTQETAEGITIPTLERCLQEMFIDIRT